MSLDMDQIAEAFCRHRFAATYPYVADEIKWNKVGGEELIGREAVIAKCTAAAKFLETVSTTLPEVHGLFVQLPKVATGLIMIPVSPSA